MYEVKGTLIILTRGDSFFATVGMKTKAGNDYTPQEGDVIRFGVKKNLCERTCLIEKVIPNDTLILQLDPEDTKPLPIGKYHYDIELTYADGSVDTFINNADFVIKAEVVD